MGRPTNECKSNEERAAVCLVAESHNPSVDAVKRAIVEALNEKDQIIEDLRRQVKDDPDADATDFAHPAWWRGQEYGVESCCRVIHEAMESGPPESGSSNCLALNRLKRKIWNLEADNLLLITIVKQAERFINTHGGNGNPPAEYRKMKSLIMPDGLTTAPTVAKALGKTTDDDWMCEPFINKSVDKVKPWSWSLVLLVMFLLGVVFVIIYSVGKSL